MKNPEQWLPTKYVWRGAQLRASRDTAQVGVGSRLIADAVAACYQQHLPRHARGRLADLGCGRAPLYLLYARHVSETVCVDWAESLHANPHLDHIVDLNRPLPFDDASFDTLILSDVLEHVAEPLGLWSEMARVLAPGGSVLLNVPFLYGIHEAPYDYARYTEHALRRFAQGCGLTVRVLQPVGGSVAVLADLLAKHLQALPVFGHALASAVQGLASGFARWPPGRRVEARTASHFPLGYFMVVTRPLSGAAT